MEALKGTREGFEFHNVWIYDGKMMYKDVNVYYDYTNILRLENKLWRLTANDHWRKPFVFEKKFTSFFLTYLFVSFWGFWVCLRMQPLFTWKYFLSFTGNAPLIFCFEFIFCFETMTQIIFLISLFFFCYDISTLVTFLMIKHMYIFS